MSHIELRGVRVHNLQNIDLRLPLGKLIAITGVSGAGKSSLAFDTLVAEARRRYIETFAPAARQVLERIERPDADSLEHLPPAITLLPECSFDGRTTLGTLTEIDDLLRQLFARLGTPHCPHCGAAMKAYSAEDVFQELATLPDGLRFVIAFPSEKSPDIIESWRRLGFVRTIETADFKAQISDCKSEIGIVVDRLVTDRAEAARVLESVSQAFSYGGGRCLVLHESLTSHEHHELPTDRRSIEQTVEWAGGRWLVAVFTQRLECLACGIEFPAFEAELFDFGSSRGACLTCGGWGVVQSDSRSEIKERCPDCGGSRLQPMGRSVFMGKAKAHNIAELRAMRLDELISALNAFAGEWTADETATVTSLFDELQSRLRTLIGLGLEYLALERMPHTLSHGERQRARLAGVLTTRLDNALYVLDEPAAGLHPSEQPGVLAALRRLQQAGNTVVVVEHQPAIIKAADEVIDLGPGAGRGGGRIVFQGSPAALRGCHESVTAKFLADARPVESRVIEQSSGTSWLRLEGATLHNLKNVSVEFPLGGLCVVAGVSGSGKSSLVQHTLWPAVCQRFGRKCDVRPIGQWTALAGGESLGNVEFLDSSPLRKSARANVITLLGAFGEIRRLFAQTTEAQVKNFTARYFSFNAAGGGRCPRCRGLGSVEIDMQFLANLTVICPECHGSRFQSEILDAKLRGLSIVEVLALTVDEAFAFFRGQPRLQRRLKTLKDVGLGYLPLGQFARTLSRGECQRLKLAALLASSSRSRTLFLMDEPSSGLHAADIEVLLSGLRRLIEVGHSLIVIEHRTELIRAADWVIELGPGAGDAGGRVISAGPTCVSVIDA